MADKCKHCGACQHCGNRPVNPPSYFPYPYAVPYGPPYPGQQYPVRYGPKYTY